MMNKFQALLSQAMKANSSDQENQDSQKSSGDDATVKTARAISQELFHHDLTDEEKKWAGPTVHYAFGTLNGALYGAVAQCSPTARAGYGTGFGTILWLAADEIAVPVFGLSGPPQNTPLSSHLMALSSHLVYGLVTEAVRRTVSKL